MKIEFLRDYRGKLTEEIFYRAGEVQDLKHGYKIVQEGAARVAAADAETVHQKEVREVKKANRRGKSRKAAR